MSTDFSIRPVGAPAAIAHCAAVERGGQQRGRDRTAGEPERHRGGRERERAQRSADWPSDFVSHQAFFDRAAASIVYQVVDNKTEPGGGRNIPTKRCCAAAPISTPSI